MKNESIKIESIGFPSDINLPAAPCTDIEKHIASVLYGYRFYLKLLSGFPI
jgi:hypothetical protein